LWRASPSPLAFSGVWQESHIDGFSLSASFSTVCVETTP
jgi:hypothetical protein